jgi:hypothetical protein
MLISLYSLVWSFLGDFGGFCSMFWLTEAQEKTIEKINPKIKVFFMAI